MAPAATRHLQRRDVHGYLWEFVSPDSRLPAVAAGSVILRGGSWKDHHLRLTSSSRRVVPAATADDAVGFRCLVSRSRGFHLAPGPMALKFSEIL